MLRIILLLCIAAAHCQFVSEPRVDTFGGDIFTSPDNTQLRFCVVSFNELKKCEEFAEAANDDPNLTEFNLACVQATDRFQCMKMISEGAADVVTLDAGLAQYGIHWHMLLPILLERRREMPWDIPPASLLQEDDDRFYDYAVALVPSNSPIRKLEDLKGKKSCHAGAGTAASWNIPMAYLIDKKYMPIVDCTVQMKTISSFFGKMCSVGSVSEAHNPFGLNPTSVCEICNSTQFEEFCTEEDVYAGYYGALQCLLVGRQVGSTGGNDPQYIYEKGDMAWVTHKYLDLENYDSQQMQLNDTAQDEFLPPVEEYLRENLINTKLLCKDGTFRERSEYKTCNWGRVPGSAVITSAFRPAENIEKMKKFLVKALNSYGKNPAKPERFNLFRSLRYGYMNKRDLLFSDSTSEFLQLKNLEHYQKFFVEQGDHTQMVDIFSTQRILSSCPSLPVRFCVTNEAEFQKCSLMRNAFKQMKLQPEIDCLFLPSRGELSGAEVCMRAIHSGDADLVNLDPGLLYIAGRDYGLIPIIASDYSGDGLVPPFAYVVAVAQKQDPITTLFNLRERRTCHPAVDTAAGWYVPLLVMIGSKVMNMDPKCDVAASLGKFLNYACVPGVLSERDPTKDDRLHGRTPVSLCEGCAADSVHKCARNSSELYYGHAGAMRCMVENAGDVAFVKHFTPRAHVDGADSAEWARNRRSQDYQLVCTNGRRASIDDFTQCNLGKIPANALVTSSEKSKAQRQLFWQLMNHAQLYFSSDSNPIFPMFESGATMDDLLFEDATSKLVLLPDQLQDYRNYLNSFGFLDIVKQLHSFDCTSSGIKIMSSTVTILLTIGFSAFASLITQF